MKNATGTGGRHSALGGLFLTLGGLALFMLFVLPWVVNCSSSSDYTDEYSEEALDANFEKIFSELPRKKGRVSISVNLVEGTLPAGSTVDLYWYPPSGATNIEFLTETPENPSGPAPYHFEDIALEPSGSQQPQVKVAYETEDAANSVDCFVAVADGDRYVYSVVGETSSKTKQETVANKSQGYWWELVNWFTTHEGSLSSSDADSTFQLVRDGQAFIAIHFPTSSSTGAFSWPLVQRESSEPSLGLIDYRRPYEENIVATAPLREAASRAEFMEKYLPQKEGWHWMAMSGDGVTSPALPQDMPIPAGDWEYIVQFKLDLTDRENSCHNCVLDSYLCYEGSEPPSWFSKAAALAKSYSGQGITCAGPFALRLLDGWADSNADPPFHIYGSDHDHVTPPGQAQLHFWLENYTTSQLSVNLDIQSDIGLSWKTYRGTYEEPDLSHPLGNSVVLPASNGEDVWLVADVPAGTPDGMEMVTITATSPSYPSKSVWQKGLVWIGDWVPPQGAAYSWWIPVAVHASGAHGSRWRTDLSLLNAGDSDATATITLYSSKGKQSMQVSLCAGCQQIIKDVISELGTEGGGALKVECEQKLFVTSRTYSEMASDDPCFPSGTLGQFLDSTANLTVLGSGSVGYIPQLVENDLFRTNIAFVNVGDTEATVNVSLRDGNGDELGSYTTTLSPGQWKQENRPFAQFGGTEAGYAVVTVTAGTVAGYGSVVDNVTNDPTTLPLVSANAASSDALIPVAIHAAGAHNSAWRTDLGLFNPSNEDAQVTLTLYASDGEHYTTYTVCGNCQEIIRDVVGFLGYEGGGSLRIESSVALLATSRTYTQTDASDACFPSGTLGQYLDSSASLLVLGETQKGYIPQLMETDSFRSNIAFTNIGDVAATVDVSLRDQSGNELGSYSVSLAPGQWKQENRPFANYGSPVSCGYALVTVRNGSVVGYGSVVDNTTNDPTTVPLVR